MSKKSLLKIKSLTIMIMEPKKIETKNILVYAKSYMDLVIYSTRYDSGKIIKMLSLLT